MIKTGAKRKYNDSGKTRYWYMEIKMVITLPRVVRWKRELQHHCDIQYLYWVKNTIH